MMQRHLFNVDTDTGTWGDTGKSFHGAVLQYRWNPTTGDTGADLQIALLPKQGDTGDGWLFVNDTDVLGTNFVRAPRQPTHDVSGDVDQTDTGTPASLAPIVAAGDRMRVKVIPGGAAVVGRLYIWTME